MFDSLPYRNDAAIIFRRLIRSLPTRRGVLGVATCDKGLPAMMLALGGFARVAVRAGARRRNVARHRGRRCRQGAIDRRPLRARRNHARRGRGAGLPRLRLARRRLPVPGHGRHVASRGRGIGLVAAAFGARALGPADLARHGPPQRAGLVESARARHQTARHSDRRRDPQRDGRACGVWRFDEFAAAHSGDRACRRPAPSRRSTIGNTSTCKCRAWSMRCPTDRSVIPRCRFFWPAACPR